MNKFFKRLALLLAVLMIVSMMPVQLFAADNGTVTSECQHIWSDSTTSWIAKCTKCDAVKDIPDIQPIEPVEGIPEGYTLWTPGTWSNYGNKNENHYRIDEAKKTFTLISYKKNEASSKVYFTAKVTIDGEEYQTVIDTTDDNNFNGNGNVKLFYYFEDGVIVNAIKDTVTPPSQSWASVRTKDATKVILGNGNKAYFVENEGFYSAVDSITADRVVVYDCNTKLKTLTLCGNNYGIGAWCNVVINPNGGAFDGKTDEYTLASSMSKNVSITADAPSKDGCTFIGWNITFAPISNVVTFTARWAAPVKVDVSVAGDEVTADVSGDSIESGAENVIINAKSTGDGMTSTVVNISDETAKAIEAAKKAVEIETNVGTLTISAQAWDTMVKNAENKAIFLNIVKHSDSKYSIEAKADAKDIFTKADDNGDVKVTVKYACDDANATVIVYHVDGEAKTNMNATYDGENLSWVTTHFSDFEIVEEKAVATVNGIDYTSLADAIAAANDGETVTLLENIDVTETLKIAKNVIINLNGKTVTANDSCVNNIFDVTGTLKIAGDGIVDLKAKGISVLGGTLEIAGGTFKYNLIGGAVVKMYDDADFKMTGGKLEIAAGAAVNTGYSKTQNIDISGGTIVCSSDHAFFASQLGNAVTNLNVSGNATIEVVNPNKFVGGPFTKVAVSGGNFNVKIDDKYLADGFELIENANGTYGVAAKTYVATIGTVGYETLDAAIKAAQDGDVIVLASGVTVYLTNGVANEGSNARKVTIKGDGTQTVDVATYAVAAEGAKHLSYQRGSSFTFDSVKVVNGEDTYDGIVCSELVYKNCTLTGVTTLYGAATFTGCTFENTMANQYSIWTWGGTDVKFEGCTFNTNGKAILLFGEEKSTNLTVNGCEFNDRMNGAAGKAAIEIGEANYGKHNDFTLVTNNCTVNGFAEGKNTGSTLWGNKNSMADENLTVIKDNEVLHGGAAKVGDKNYATLEEALAAVTKDSPLTWVSETVWPVDTPVYYNGNFYKAHTVNYVSKGALDWAIEAANTDNSAEVAKIYVRPGYNTENGLVVNSHQNIKTSIAVYGNDASLCGIGWEPCVEYPGENYHTLTKDISIEIYNLHDGASVWGQRMTKFTVDVTMENCKNVHELMINGQYASASASVTNYTVRNCTFDGSKASAACPVTTTSAGKVIVEGCTFTGLNDNYVININNKNGGKTVVEVTDCEFNGCGATGKEVVRLTGEAEGSTIAATLSGLTFDETSSANAIIVGNKKVENNKASVSYTITGTSGTMNSYRIGETTAETTVLAGEEVKGNNAVAVVEVTFTDGTVKLYSDIAEALEAARSGHVGPDQVITVKLLSDVVVPAGTVVSRTIDLNGYTLTTDDLNLDSSNGRELFVTDSSESKNGKLIITGSGDMDVCQRMTLNAGTIETSRNIVVQSNGFVNYFNINGGTLIFKNGAKFISTYGYTVTITGGKFITDAESLFAVRTTYSTLNIVIKGGDFTQVGKLTESTSNIKFSISGGKFSFDIPEEYCAKDYYPAHFNDGTMGVKKETVSTEEELRRALYEAALDGSLTRIKLTGNITLEMQYSDTLFSHSNEVATWKAFGFSAEEAAILAAASENGVHKDWEVGVDTLSRYKYGVKPEEGSSQWNPLVTNQTWEQRAAFGGYIHATDDRVARLVIKAGQNVVIDLNGYTIEKKLPAAHGSWDNTFTNIIGNYGTLEIKDSAGTNGTIKGCGYISCSGAVLHNYEGGVMTVGAVNVDGNAAGMAAGTGQYVIANDGGKTTINGTNVYDTATSASLVVNTAGEMTITGNATLNHPATKTINVKGGDVVIESATIISDASTIYAKDGKTTITGEVTVNGTGKMAVNGGEIVKTADATVGGVPEGYAWFDNDDGTQSLGKAYAKIGETYYKSLADALDAANAGDTIVLLENVTLNSSLEINKGVTIDLNKNTIDTKAGVRAITITSGNVTIKNGTVKMGTVVNGSTRETADTIYIKNTNGENVTLNLENVTVIGGENQKSGVTDATVEQLIANGMYYKDTTAGTALRIDCKNSDGNTIVNIKNSTIIGGYGSATNGTQTAYISGGANYAMGGIGIYALGDNVVLNITDGSTIKGGDSDLYNAGIGVSFQSGALTVDGSTVTGGSCLKCKKGRGIAGSAVTVTSVVKSATIKNSTIIGGNGGYSWDGSGIEISGTSLGTPAQVTIEDSTIKSGNGENANKDYAGAILINGYQVSIDLALKGDNTLAGSDGKYGAIRNGLTDGIKLDGNLTIAEGTLKNTAFTEVSAGSTIKTEGTAKVDVDTVISIDENAAMDTTPSADGTYSFVAAVAQVIDRYDNKISYASIEEAFAAANDGETVKLLADVTANVVIPAGKNITLDLNGKTLNGGTGNTKATIENYGTITITDSSAEKTGTIKRDDNGIEGETSYYVILNLGTMTIEQANVINNSGYKKANSAGSMVGSSLICNGDNDAYSAVLNIKGGTFQQENFIAIKNGSSATLNVTGGTITSKHSAVQNWCNANITGGELNGQLWTDSWESNSTGNTVIGGDAKFTGEIVIDITGSIVPKLEIKGGTLDVTNWRITTAAANAGAKPEVSGGTFAKSFEQRFCAKGFELIENADGTYGVKAAMKGSKYNPYKLDELGKMTRDEYIAAQEALGGTMYVEVGDYSYDTHGVLGNGKRDDTTGQKPDHSMLNSYGENGYLGANNDGANGKNIIFVGGSITSNVTGYASIDSIGTDLLLAVPAYTNVTFEGVTFNNVMSFNYQLYTSPWSQLGELKFSGCTFNGLIVGSIAAQTLTFDGCVFTNYTNSASANNSNPTWIRPAYGNWTKGDNEGQGEGFRSLTTINFTNNTVTSTRPVKFEYISQWDITSTVTATGNYFDIKAQAGDKVIKNVGLYLGAHTDANEFHLVAENNTKSENTAAIYTIPSGKTSLPVDSTVKNKAGESIELTDALKWKATDAEKDKIVLKTVVAVASIGETRFATLAEAVEAAKNGDTITLLSDVELDDCLTITADKNITLNTNGKTITNSKGSYAINNLGTLTINGGGKIVRTNAGNSAIRTIGTLTLADVTVEVNDKKIAIKVDEDGVGTYGKLIVNDGTVLTSAGQAIQSWGEVVVNGGTINGEVAAWSVKGWNPGKIVIKGGTINGNVTAYQRYYNGTYPDTAAEIKIEDGTIEGILSLKYVEFTNNEIKDRDASEFDVKGTIVVSGGRFKNKVDDKYFDKDHACSTTPGDDGYYTVEKHPITGFGVTIGEGLSLRIYVDGTYKDGVLLYSYKYDDNAEEKTGMISHAVKDKDGRLIFRITDINAQKADVIYKIQYCSDKEGKVKVGAEKEVSILKYCQLLNGKDKNADETDAVKKQKINTLISKMLEYSASMMDYVYTNHKNDVLNGLSWNDRAKALRAEIAKLCSITEVTNYDFNAILTPREDGDASALGTNKFGIRYSDSLILYYNINYNENYVYTYNGIKFTPEKETNKSGETVYRFYITLAPHNYFGGHCIHIVDKQGNFVYEIEYSLENVLEVLANKYPDDTIDKATYEYCKALKDAYQYFK